MAAQRSFQSVLGCEHLSARRCDCCKIYTTITCTKREVSQSDIFRVCICAAKIFAFVGSQSKAILASLADSGGANDAIPHVTFPSPPFPPVQTLTHHFANCPAVGGHCLSPRLPTLLHVPSSGPRVTGCHLSDGVQDEAALASVSCGTSEARGMHCAHSIVSLSVLLTSTWRLHFGPLKRAPDAEE